MNAHSGRPASPLVQGKRPPLFHQDLGQDGLRLVVRKNCRPPIQVWVRSRRQAQQVLLRQRSAWNPPNSPNTNQGASVIPDECRIYANAKLKWPSVVLFRRECHFYRGAWFVVGGANAPEQSDSVMRRSSARNVPLDRLKRRAM